MYNNCKKVKCHDHNKIETDSYDAKEFQEACQRINDLETEYCQVKKRSIHVQMIETIVERLPTIIMMTSILYVSFEYERLRYLVGLPLKNKFYVFVVAASYVCTIYGIISTLINLRFVYPIFNWIPFDNFKLFMNHFQEHGIFAINSKFVKFILSNLIPRINFGCKDNCHF